jgi:hypothetical protein
MVTPTRLAARNLTDMLSADFSRYTKNSIALARQNLADVVMFNVLTKPDAVERHVMGNFLIASTALGERSGQLVGSMTLSLVAAGSSLSHGQEFIRTNLSHEFVSEVAALSHIPENAPELRHYSNGRSLDVDQFMRLAHDLNPSGLEPRHMDGMGVDLMLGSISTSLV